MERQLPEVLHVHLCSNFRVSVCKIELKGLFEMVSLVGNKMIFFISFQIYYILIVQWQRAQLKGSIAPPKLLGASQKFLL